MMRKELFLKLVVFVAVVGLFALPAVAQKLKTIAVDRDGEFHVYSQTKVGDKTIKAGMYRISHEYVDNEHFLVIRKVSYSRSMGSSEIGGEVARVKCTIGPVKDQYKKSKILVRRNSANKRVAMEVWFRGEKLKHILSTQPT